MSTPLAPQLSHKISHSTFSLQNKYLKSTMSIAPVAFEDISLQLEAGMPEDGNKSAKADFAAAPLKGGKSRFVTFSVIIAAAVGVGLVLGLSLGLSGNKSNNSQSAAVEQPTVSNSNTASTFNGSTQVKKEVKNYLCAFAGQIPADGTIILGQSIMPTSSDYTLEDVPACFDGADTDGAWNSAWYKVRACQDGDMTATFSDLYTPTLNTQASALDARVSAYEGSCGEQLQCIGTQDQDIMNTRLGSSTWTAVKGQTYKLRVQHMPGASFGLTVNYSTGTSTASTQSSLLLNNVCANADPIPVDGTVVIGNAGIPLPEDLPVCVEGRRNADGGWYTVQAEKTGRMVANFVAFYEHSDIDDFVSVYEGACGDVVTCVDGSYAFDGENGYYTWDAVEGVDYKIVVHSTGPFSLDVTSV
jgi:hypothetical protein